VQPQITLVELAPVSLTGKGFVGLGKDA